jgi:hypothetical protein
VENTTVVLAVWVVGTGAAVLARGHGVEARRWALALCIADLPLFAAVAWTASTLGFERWPERLDTPAVVLLLAAALLRAPLASGPDDRSPDPGLLVVRTQAAALILVSLGSGPARHDLLVGVALLAAFAFALGGWASRAATRDAVQEMALVGLVVAAARAGTGATGWEWGALAAGTLIHNLRLRVDSPWVGPLAARLLSGGGLGLPLLPVVLVGLEGSFRSQGLVRPAMMVALVTGLAARASAEVSPGVDDPRTTGAPRWAAAMAAALAAAAIAAALWAPLFTLPRPPGASPMGWPPVWAGAGVLAAAGVGGLFARERGVEVVRRRVWRPAVGDPRPPAGWSSPVAVTGALLVLAAGAAGMWIVGVVRGFL